MTRRRIGLLVVLAAVLLAGCMGGPTGGPSTESGPDDEPTNASSATVPGVTNGSLTNASALARAHVDELARTGGTVNVTDDTGDSTSSFRYVVAPDYETYSLTGTHERPEATPVDVSLWTNESVRIVRQTSEGEDHYRVVDRRRDVPSQLASLSTALSAGDFTVANESAGPGTVVLTADGLAAAVDRHSRYADATAVSGRVVLEESGLIRTLTLDATVDGESHSLRYAVTETGIDTVPRPGWVEDLPPGATVQAQLDVDVENESLLVVRNQAGDAVPAGSVVSVSTGTTDGEVTLAEPLAVGDRRYVAVDASTGTLTIATDRPPAEATASIEPPVSVSVRTEGGVTLLDAGMSWESGSASATESGGGAASSSGEGASGSATESARVVATR